ncbi:MAG: hemopexin repeat-containing protein, partial [Pseudonocardiaceae bacterium]
IQDCYRALDAEDVGSSLWLMQLLFAVVAWMQATGFTSQELIQILGGATARTSGPPSSEDDQTAVLESLREQFETVALAPDLFVSQRFSQRASQVVYDILTTWNNGVVSHRDERLLRVDPATAASAAYDALANLAVIADADFLGLGLEERLTAKIFTNLVIAGYLESNGALVESKLPNSPTDFRLASDFSSRRDALFELIYGFSAGEAEDTVPDGEPAEEDYSGEEDYSDEEFDGPRDMASFFPSDLATLDDLTTAEREELYDNLIVNGYIDAEGNVLRPEFFTDPENVAVFAVNAEIGDIAPEVLARLREPIERFRNERLALDPEIFAALALSDAQLADLLENLRFNGYIDQEGLYTDKKALIELKPDDLGLALEFYPHHRGVLDAIRAQIGEFKAQMCTFAPEDFREIADDAVTQQVVTQLDGSYLYEDRVPEDIKAFFTDPESHLEMGEGFTASDRATIFHRISTILQEQQAYQLDPAALTALGFDTDEREQLLGVLIDAGHLNGELTVPESRLPYFSNVNNALDFSLAGLEDYNKDIFFLLHAVATQLRAGIAEITATLAAQAGKQLDALLTVVQDAFGVTAATAEAICSSVVGSAEEALELLVGAALAAADDAGTDDAGTVTAASAPTAALLAYRRIRSFALLAARLGLDATEVSVAFQDQDLVGKFPESLALPPGVDRFDALLRSADGNIYLFSAGNYWVYSAATYLLTDKQPRPLGALSNQFTGLTGIDAAFTDASGTEWIIGRDPTGSHAFVKEPGSRRWASKEQAWGKVKNNFADPARIDSAFVDDEGKTYLFCGDQYVRYSGADYTYADEGYPRRIGQWWEGEGRNAQLPERFRTSLDASFQGRDGKTHLFKGDRWLAVGDGSVEGSVPDVWGKVRNTFTEAGRVDAAYSTDSGYFFFSGSQLVRYSDSIENDGVCVDDGYPRQIESHLPTVPAEFEAALDAAFVDRAGVLHLFKDGKTISLKAGAGTVASTADRWGLLGPILPSGTVDAAFVGLDGKTYLFSGDQYLRYSGADYAVVDVGYPRGLAGDWGGLQRVDASFVLDGVTYLFGTGVNGATAYVRYSTRNYAAPDPGYPKPLPDNWWNLPAGLVEGGAFTTVDAVFTGRDNRTYLFSGGHFVVFDNKYRWWSEPRTLRQHWDSIPFSRIDAAFVGKDGKTYVFSGRRYVRYSNGDYTRIDDRYPAAISTFWGNVVNNIARTGRVDAALVIDSPETVGGAEVVGEHTYLFSGNQYVRYSGGEYSTVDDGYPKSITSLAREPRFRNLQAVLDR